MRRRRKTKYTWLPIQNGATFLGDVDFDRSSQQFILDVPNNGASVVGIIPVVADLPQGTITTVETEGIGEIVGNEYVLKRIVGKCHVHLDFQNLGGPGEDIGIDTVEDAAVVVTAGFFVARADPTNLLLPIGAGEASGDVLYSPANADLTRQPWIWRRTWILGVGAFGPGAYEDIGGTLGGQAIIRGRGTYPQNNVFYGSVADGPHIDAKTGRRIRLEERLWFAATAYYHNATGAGSANLNTFATFNLDARYLGALRRPRGRSNFA